MKQPTTGTQEDELDLMVAIAAKEFSETLFTLKKLNMTKQEEEEAIANLLKNIQTKISRMKAGNL